MAGARLPMLGARLSPGDRTVVEVIPFGPGHERVQLGPHVHNDLELMFFAAGEGTDQLGEQQFDVRAGDILLVTPGIVHDARRPERLNVPGSRVECPAIAWVRRRRRSRRSRRPSPPRRG